MIRVKLKRVVSNNVQRFFSGGNSYYEKFDDGRVRCIDEEIPFEIPQGWEWARLNDVCSYIQRGKSPVYSEIKKYPVIAQKCNQWSGFSIEKAQFIAPDTVAKYSDERLLQEKDLLWNSTGLGTLGRMAVYSMAKNPYGWAVADSHVTVIRPLQLFMNSFYLYAYFSSPTVQSVIEDKAEGSTKQKELYVDTVKTYLIPVPPYSEQNRITEIIDSVLPIVSKYGHSQDKLDKLNVEIKNRLQKSILQEAIQGKLVPQDPNDGPVLALLEKIQVEKLKLLEVGKLKKKDIVDSEIYKGEDNKYYENVGNIVLDISDEIPFVIPDSWQWVRLGYLFAHNTGKALNKADTGGVLKKYLTTSNVYWNRFDFNEVREMFFADSEVDKCTVRKGDLLVCEGGDIGRAAIWPFEYEICIQNHIHRLRAYYPVSTEFYYYVFELYKGIGHIGGKGIGIQGLSSGALHNLVFPLPPVQEQERIVLKIKEMSRFL